MIDRRNVDNLTKPGLRPAVRDVVRIARGPWAGRVGDVEAVKGKYLTVRVDPKWTRTQRERISNKVAQLRDEGMERAQAVRAAFEEERKRSPAMKFLVNPPRDKRGRFKKAGKSRKRTNPKKRQRTMARHRRWVASEHPRGAHGRFVRTTGRGHERHRNAPARLTHPRERAYHHERWSASAHPRNRLGQFVSKGGSRRHNPYRRRNPGWGFMDMLKDGVIDSVEITAGKAVVRKLPEMVKITSSTNPNVSLAIQLALAIGLGWAGDKLSPEVGRNLIAGGFQAPLEDLLAAHVPGFATVLTPMALTPVTTSATGTTSGYANRAGQVKLLPGAKYVTSPPGSGVRRIAAGA